MRLSLVLVCCAVVVALVAVEARVPRSHRLRTRLSRVLERDSDRWAQEVQEEHSEDEPQAQAPTPPVADADRFQEVDISDPAQASDTSDPAQTGADAIKPCCTEVQVVHFEHGRSCTAFSMGPCMCTPDAMPLGCIRPEGNPAEAQDLATPAEKYTVVVGDTLESIAKAHSLTVKRLAEFNPQHQGDVKPGEVLDLTEPRAQKKEAFEVTEVRDLEAKVAADAAGNTSPAAEAQDAKTLAEAADAAKASAETQVEQAQQQAEKTDDPVVKAEAKVKEDEAKKDLGRAEKGEGEALIAAANVKEKQATALKENTLDAGVTEPVEAQNMLVAAEKERAEGDRLVAAGQADKDAAAKKEEDHKTEEQTQEQKAAHEEHVAEKEASQEPTTQEVVGAAAAAHGTEQDKADADQTAAKVEACKVIRDVYAQLLTDDQGNVMAPKKAPEKTEVALGDSAQDAAALLPSFLQEPENQASNAAAPEPQGATNTAPVPTATEAPGDWSLYGQPLAVSICNGVKAFSDAFGNKQAVLDACGADPETAQPTENLFSGFAVLRGKVIKDLCLAAMSPGDLEPDKVAKKLFDAVNKTATTVIDKLKESVQSEKDDVKAEEQGEQAGDAALDAAMHDSKKEATKAKREAKVAAQEHSEHDLATCEKLFTACKQPAAEGKDTAVICSQDASIQSETCARMSSTFCKQAKAFAGAATDFCKSDQAWSQDKAESTETTEQKEDANLDKAVNDASKEDAAQHIDVKSQEQREADGDAALNKAASVQ